MINDYTSVTTKYFFQNGKKGGWENDVGVWVRALVEDAPVGSRLKVAVRSTGAHYLFCRVILFALNV
jgi:hypothetical protein